MILQASMAIVHMLAAGGLSVGFSYRDTFQGKDARIALGIRSNDYVYTIANDSYEPITRVRIPQHSAYAFTAPEGWEKKVEDGLYEAWTDDIDKAIPPGRTRSFGFRVKSEGAVLARGTVIVQFDSKRTATVQGVLHPALEGGGYIFTVAAIGMGLIGLHLLLVIRAGRRKGDTPTDEG